MVARNRPIHKGLRQIGSRIGIAFFVLALAQCPSACADKITSMLTARDLAHPTILTPSGEVVSPTSRTAGAAGSAATPTYVAYALTGGEHLPADITTLNATSVAGLTSTGPLDFTPTLETSLTSALSSSNAALVQTSSQEYLVSYLPRFAAESSSSTSATKTSTTGGGSSTRSSTSSATTTSWNLGPLTVNNINGISVKQINSVFDTGSKDLSAVTSSAVGDLGKLLDINNSHRSVSRPSLNLAVSSSTTTGQQEAQVLEVPAPEPGTWVFFSILLAAISTHERLRRARTARSLATAAR